MSNASPPVADALPLPPATTIPRAPNERYAIAFDEDTSSTPRFVLGAGAHLAFGASPGLGIGLRASAEVATIRWSLGLEGRYDLPASGETTTGAQGRSSLAGAAFTPCVRARATYACAVVLVSRVAASTTDEATPALEKTFLFVGLGARFALHVALPASFALRLSAELLGHPVHYRLVRDGRLLLESSVISATVGPSLVRAF